jgi:hypothetical protein
MDEFSSASLISRRFPQSTQEVVPEEKSLRGIPAPAAHQVSLRRRTAPRSRPMRLPSKGMAFSNISFQRESLSIEA